MTLRRYAPDSTGRLSTLDGLRAVAACMVFLHHADSLVGFRVLLSGYLAVDFFFLLSGFVMARAYDQRLASGLTPLGMMRARLIRLYPTIIVGILAGAALALAQGMAPDRLAMLFAKQMLFIPTIVTGSMVGIYVLNGVQWSLLFELVANACHALFLHRLSTRALAIVAALAVLPLILTIVAFGTLAVGDKGINFWGGFGRTAFPYLCGMLLHRLAAKDRLPFAGRHGGWWMAILIAAVVLPNLAGVSGWKDILIVTAVFPLIVAGGASAWMGRRWSWLSDLGGRYSYPFYVAQFPAIELVHLLARPLHLHQGIVSLLLAALCAILATVATERLAALLSWSFRPKAPLRPAPEVQRLAKS